MTELIGAEWVKFITHVVATGVIVGILIMPLTLVVGATILRQRRSPASSMVWLITILFLPLLGIPLFWLFSNRKIDRIARQRQRVALSLTDGGGKPFALDRSPAITLGNSLRFHANGEEAFADVLRLIDEAKRSIYIETFVLEADETGAAILERLIKRAGDGLEVRLLIDGLGSFHVRRRLLRQLKMAKGKYEYFMPIWRVTLINRSNLRNHRKIAVFDGARVFAGGRNLAGEYLGPTPRADRWTDLSFVLEGPAVAHYAEIFRLDWAFASWDKERLAPPPPSTAAASTAGSQGAALQVVPSGPDVVSDDFYQALLSLLFRAEKRIWVVTPYFVPNELMLEALLIAARRGLDVRVVVPEKPDQFFSGHARGPCLRDLANAGGNSLLYTPGFIHAKAVLIDNTVAAVGSANFDSRSMFLNFEVSSVIFSPTEIASLEAWITGILSRCRPIEKTVGTGRQTLESVARLVTPML
jgi:cardiolipin synthase A/B